MGKERTNYASQNKKLSEMEPVKETKVEAVEEKTEKAPRFKSYAAKVTGCANLNVRKEPSLNAEVLNVIAVGTEVTVTGNKNGWVSVKVGDTLGWCMENYISMAVSLK